MIVDSLSRALLIVYNGAFESPEIQTCVIVGKGSKELGEICESIYFARELCVINSHLKRRTENSTARNWQGK